MYILRVSLPCTIYGLTALIPILIFQPKLGTLIPFKCPDGKSVGSAGDCQFDNCVALDDQLQLSWTVRDDQKMIDFRLCGCLSTDPKSVGVILTQN